MMYAPEDKNRRASSQSRAVRPVTNINCQPQSPNRVEVYLIQETSINAMPIQKLFHLNIPAANTVNIPTGYPQGFHLVIPGSKTLVSYRKENGFQASSRARFS
jgi:hypothetical protein